MSFEERQAATQTALPLIVKVLFIFGMALLLRLAVSYYNAAADSGEYLFQDSSSYYRMAVNLANGHGYVLKQGQEPYFFREPGTTYFFAGGVGLYRALTGRSVVEPSYDRNNWPEDHDNRNVIRLIRLGQAVLQAIALALFYLLLRHSFKDAAAFVIAALASLYPPLALFSEQLMRENLLLAALMVVAYMLSSQVRRPAYWKLAVIGIFWGLAALTLQVYMVLGVFLCAFLFLGTRSVLLATRRCAVIAALFLVTVLPWLHEVYTFYPDVRIAGSMGCALTSDWSRLFASLRFANSRSQGPSGTGNVRADPLLATDMYAFTTRECFDNAYSGRFRQMARQLDMKYGRPSAVERAREYAGMLAWFLVLPGYQYDDWSATRSVAAHDHGNMAVTMFLSFVLSACSIIGLWMCRRKASATLPVYLFHLAFFWILMSASRRALPVVPFFVLFGMVGLSKVVQLGFPQFRFSIFRES
jgi:4-amino-4-deoxy-L-arabinose transferase-like glycosyltransferase